MNEKHFEQYCFNFNNFQYGYGTIVKIYKNKRNHFGCCTNVIFEGYNRNNDRLYHFSSLHDKWDDYCMTKDELELYIEKIEHIGCNNDLQNDVKIIPPSYIEGIVDAWIWYIIVIFFAVFIKGIGSTIIIWTISSWIFWSWRKNKMNGG